MIVLTSSRDGADFGPLIERSGARVHPQGGAVGRAAPRAHRMTSLKRALIAIGAPGFAAGLVAMALILTSDWQSDQRARTSPSARWSAGPSSARA